MEQAAESTAVAEILPAGNMLPAAIADYKVISFDAQRLKEVLASNVAAGISPFDLDRIKVPSGGSTVWQVPSLEGTKNLEVVEGVIVGMVDQRAFWRNAFTGAGAPPDCSSKDALVGMGDPGGQCARCQFAQFGSAEKRNERTGELEKQAGQACKQVKLLFLLRPAGLLPMVVAAPPTSLGEIKKYMLRLASEGIPYARAVTALRLAQDKNAGGIQYSKIEPRFVKELNDAEAKRIGDYAKAIQSVFTTIEATAEEYGAAS